MRKRRTTVATAGKTAEHTRPGEIARQFAGPRTDSFFGTSEGRTGYFRDKMVEQLDGQNLFVPSAASDVLGTFENVHPEYVRSAERKAEQQTKLRKAMLKDARIETSALRSRERVAAQPELAAKSQVNRLVTLCKVPRFDRKVMV